MRSEDLKNRSATVAEPMKSATWTIHPAWSAFIRYCEELQHGEIELLKIQDGVPILAEVARKKFKFT